MTYEGTTEKTKSESGDDVTVHHQRCGRQPLDRAVELIRKNVADGLCERVQIDQFYRRTTVLAFARN